MVPLKLAFIQRLSTVALLEVFLLVVLYAENLHTYGPGHYVESSAVHVELLY